MVQLYGTPPNVNGYLQRIGRAGRWSKQALVLSVSKRNPIDLYYYRCPLQQIASRPQLVPLQEHNERVLEAALTAALLDFVASTFTIPWLREGTGADLVVRCGGEPARVGQKPSGGPAPLTWMGVLNARTEVVETSALVALEGLVSAHDAEARAYLNGLLDYHLCARCGHRTPTGATACPRPGCGGEPESAATHLAPFVDAALAKFGERIVWAPGSVIEEYSKDHMERDEQAAELRRERQRVHPREHGEIDRKLCETQAHQQVALTLEAEARLASLRDNQDRSAYVRFGYGIRGSEDEVALELVSSAQGELNVERTSRVLGRWGAGAERRGVPDRPYRVPVRHSRRRGGHLRAPARSGQQLWPLSHGHHCCNRPRTMHLRGWLPAVPLPVWVQRA